MGVEGKANECLICSATLYSELDMSLMNTLASQ